ncbi:MAG: molybdenum cofactor guanylyltransferase [Gemmatimonadaceae bacterium]|nr:molybdenum cofactor guanylyltransferase [Gemmatimonadaceae bacterium]
MTGTRQRRRGVLLAGGASSRFGGVAKGLLPLGAMRLADAALAALRETCDDVVIAANDDTAEFWFREHPVVRDAEAGRGALGALETALLAGDGANVVVCAWDMPFMTADVLEQLAQAVEAGANACVPVRADASSEPLCAAYAPSCAAVASTLLARGERSAQALWREVGGASWDIDTMLTPERAARTFFNVNTPDDLRRAEAWVFPFVIRST